MKVVGMFQTKTHLTELMQEVEHGEELCITNRGREVAFIIPVKKYYKNKFGKVFDRFSELKKRASLGSAKEILQMKSEGLK
jgi:prevent-host-death family protein